jgi:hypothetical protein
VIRRVTIVQPAKIQTHGLWRISRDNCQVVAQGNQEHNLRYIMAYKRGKWKKSLQYHIVRHLGVIAGAQPSGSSLKVERRNACAEIKFLGSR